ncbi:MAG TPA: SWIM zinc finger family protein [Micromonosporaceae bacterium]|nr:SWIM zinc finger family protein [Micromonosporaceae bacterium]
MAWFTEADLRGIAGSRSYARGVGYVDAVTGLGELPDGVTATVPGTAGRYRVRLTGELDGGLDGDCSCPYGQEGNFCKHCVAVGLYLLQTDNAARERSGVDSDTEAGRARGGAKFDVRSFLGTMTHTDLVDLLAQQAQHDSGLFRKLRLMALTAAQTPDLTELSRQVQLLAVDWLDYDAAGEYAKGADDLLQAMDQLLPANAAAVQPLLRRAMRHLGEAAGAAEGDAYSITEAAGQAWELYLRACETAAPDPVELAEWLIDFQLTGPEWPDLSLAEMVELLGDTGLDHYRQCLAAAPEHGPGQWRLRHLREDLVSVSGDTDAMVKFLAEDLSGPHQFVRIAQLLHGDGRDDEAIDWLERGFATGRGPHDHNLTTLVDLLAELYAQTGRDTQVIGLRERHFTAAASESSYRALRAAAGRTAQWPALRTRALDLLRRQARGQADWSAADTLARVLLDEDEVTEAWQVTQDHHCTEPVRLAVTARRAQTHPADAIAVYRPMVATAIQQTNNAGYERAAQLLLTMRPLFARTGEDFSDYVAQLREANRRKRNLIAELSRNGL